MRDRKPSQHWMAAQGDLLQAVRHDGSHRASLALPQRGQHRATMTEPLGAASGRKEYLEGGSWPAPAACLCADCPRARFLPLVIRPSRAMSRHLLELLPGGLLRPPSHMVPARELQTS